MPESDFSFEGRCESVQIRPRSREVHNATPIWDRLPLRVTGFNLSQMLSQKPCKILEIKGKSGKCKNAENVA